MSTPLFGNHAHAKPWAWHPKRLPLEPQVISLAGELFQESLSIFVIRFMFQCSANAAEGGRVVLLSLVNQGQVEVNRGRRHAVGQSQIHIVDGLLIVLQFEMEQPSIQGRSSNGRI